MQSRSVYAALVLVQVFFATLPIAAKIALRELSSPALALLRVSAAAAVFLLMHRAWVGERVRGRHDWLTLALYSVFGVILNQLLYITSLSLTTATAAQTMVTAGPALTLLVAILLGRERATAAKWAGIALAGSGALWLVGVGLREGSALGNLLALLNVAAYSVYLVISRGLLRRYNALTVVTWTFVFGAVGIFPWGILPLVREVGSASDTTWIALAYIVAVPTVGAYYLNVFALSKVESSVVSVFVYIQPILTALLAVPFLGERLNPRLLPAALLIFAGVSVTALAARMARRAAVPSPAGQAGAAPSGDLDLDAEEDGDDAEEELEEEEDDEGDRERDGR